MDTTSDEKNSGSSENQPEKWLQKIADLQADVRALRAQLSVVRGLVTSANRQARWTSKEDDQPCWCEEKYMVHDFGCAELRRLTRALGEQMGEAAL